MRIGTSGLVIAVAFLVGVGCSGGSGSSSSGSGSTAGGTGGSGSTGQCNTLVTQMCQEAVACSPSGTVVFAIGANADAGIHSFDFEVNGGESQCETVVGSGCDGTHAASFTANCAGASGYACGPSASHGNGLMVPGACWNSL